MIVLFLMTLLILAATHIYIIVMMLNMLKRLESFVAPHEKLQSHDDRTTQDTTHSRPRTETEALVKDESPKPPEYCKYRQHCTYSSTDG